MLKSLVTVLCLQPAFSQCEPAWLGSPLNGANHVVWDAVEWDPDGSGPLPLHLVVAGSFTLIADIEAQGIAMRNQLTGQWSVLGEGLTGGSVRALAVTPNGDLLAGGAFLSSGATPIAALARWDAQTGWQEFAGGIRGLTQQTPGQVHDLLIAANGDVVVAGNFRSVGSSGSGGTVAANNCARWIGTSWLTLAGGRSGTVEEVAEAPNGDLFVHGLFPAQPTGQNRFARFDGGGSWSAIPGPTKNATILALPNGDLLAAFEETGVGLQRWDGSTWTVVAPPGYASAGDVILRGNGDIVVGGRSITAGPYGPLDGLAVWNGTSWSGLGLQAGQSTAVNVLFETAAGPMVVGGAISAGLGPGLGRNLLEYDFADGELRAVSRGFSNQIAVAIETQNGDLYVGGLFSSTPGGLAAHVARLDSTGTWQPLGSGLAGRGFVSVTSMTARPGGGIYVAGTFTTAGGVAADGIAAWNGSSWTALPSGPHAPTNPSVDLEVMPNGDLVASGAFGIRRFDGNSWTVMSGVPAASLAVLENGSLAALMGTARVWIFDSSGWNIIGQIAGRAHNLAATSNGLIVVGEIAAVDGVAVDRVAHYDGANWAGFPAMGVAFVTDLIELPDGDLVAFGSVGSVPGAAFLALRYSAGGNAWSWAADPIRGGVFNRVAKGVVRQSGEVVAVGSFERLGNRVATSIARWIPPCRAAVVSDGAGCAGAGGISPTLRTQSTPWLGQTYELVGSGVPANSLAIAVIGAIAPAVPLVPLGAPGCTLNVTPDALLTLLAPASGEARFSIAVPTIPTLAGQTFGQQIVAVEFASGGGLLQLTSSNTLATTLGSY